MHSKMIPKLKALIICFLVHNGALLSSAAVAQANINTTCRFGIVPVRFGMYNPIDDVDKTNDAGSVSLQCQSPSATVVSYSIALGAGTGTYGARTLRVATYVLEYNLYSNAGYNIVWGDGTGGSVTVPGSFSVPAGPNYTDGVSHTIYSRITKRQYKPGGVYNDNISVSAIF